MIWGPLGPLGPHLGPEPGSGSGAGSVPGPGSGSGPGSNYSSGSGSGTQLPTGITLTVRWGATPTVDITLTHSIECARFSNAEHVNILGKVCNTALKTSAFASELNHLHATPNMST